MASLCPTNIQALFTGKDGHMFWGWLPNPYVRIIFDLAYGNSGTLPAILECANAVHMERRVPIGLTMDELIPLWYFSDYWEIGCK